MATTNMQTVSVRAPDAPKHGQSMQVTSSSFAAGESIPLDFVFTGCGGKNTAPQLAWSGAPDGTKSYAITCFDPDAPTGSGYWHWLAFNIPASVTSLEAGAGNDESPAGGTSSMNDYGMRAYGGPCPPKGDGDHRYIFTVYALDVDRLPNATEKVSGATLCFLMRGHVLATGSIVGRFGH
jgi:Raf kinase inhibitor-like YbhB/YbcL family protein